MEYIQEGRERQHWKKDRSEILSPVSYKSGVVPRRRGGGGWDNGRNV
jgi:hypothetical protein